MRIAVVPARGGSRRIPRKNVRSFCGKPMIAWTIEAALGSGLFEHVLVSTDDEETRQVAVACGAEAPFVRPAELANDHATTTAVIGHAAQWALDAGWALDAVCCLYPTPFIHIGDLTRGLEAFRSGDWSFAVAATACATTVFRSFRLGKDGGIEMLFPEFFETRSQDLPRALHDAGQFYWGSPAAWIEGRRVFDHWSVPVLIPGWRVQDIDVPDDWARAEIMFEQLKGRLRE